MCTFLIYKTYILVIEHVYSDLSDKYGFLVLFRWQMFYLGCTLYYLNTYYFNVLPSSYKSTNIFTDITLSASHKRGSCQWRTEETSWPGSQNNTHANHRVLCWQEDGLGQRGAYRKWKGNFSRLVFIIQNCWEIVILTSTTMCIWSIDNWFNIVPGN